MLDWATYSQKGLHLRYDTTELSEANVHAIHRESRAISQLNLNSSRMSYLRLRAQRRKEGVAELLCELVWMWVRHLIVSASPLHLQRQVTVPGR